jgi:hypothetical protein
LLFSALIHFNCYFQLVFAVGDPNVAAQQLVPMGANAAPSAPLAYKQIYQSPWASRYHILLQLYSFSPIKPNYENGKAGIYKIFILRFVCFNFILICILILRISIFLLAS